MARVAVLGAGVAGLATAYKLNQKGHDVMVLEGKHRPGGLSHTARDGDVVVEQDPTSGAIAWQTARLDPGQSINLGPGRLPHHHRRILALCRELGVELEPYMMTSDANWFVARNGQRYRRRWLESDARGYLAEQAYQSCTDPNMRDMARAFGDLDESGKYRGTDRGGPDREPIDRDELAALAFWQSQFWQPSNYLWQDTLFQPVGGMDMIWRALMRRVGHLVHLNAPVTAVGTARNGASVTWTQGGAQRSGWFDWVASSIPMPVLTQRVRMSGFSDDYRAAARVCEFAPACKVGWQAERRFWEDEEIYGGISYTADPIGQFWYPSSGHFGQKGTLTGAYCYYDAAAELGAMPPAERIDQARVQGAKIHAEVADQRIVPDFNAVAIAWHKVPGQAGGWAAWHPQADSHAQAFARLLNPERRFVAIGDQVSDLPGWQEGCMKSAERAVSWIEGTAEGYYSAEDVEVPNAFWLTAGDHPWGAVDVGRSV